MKRKSVQNNGPKKVFKTITDTAMNTAAGFKSNVDEVNVGLISSCTLSKASKIRGCGGGRRRRNRRKGKYSHLKKSSSVHESAFNKRATKKFQHSKSTEGEAILVGNESKKITKSSVGVVGLQRLPHFVCQFNNCSSFKPNIFCPAGNLQIFSRNVG